MKKGFKAASAAIIALSAITPVAVFANETTTPVETGIYTATSHYTFAEFRKLTRDEKIAIILDETSLFVLGNAVINQSQVMDSTSEELNEILVNPNASVEKYIADGITFGENGYTGTLPITITSVSAITTTIDEDGGQLEFAINGENKAADLKALEAAGYTVEFKASGAVTSINTSTGQVTGIESGTKTFRYSVVISNEEGVVETSESVTVTVEEYDNVVTELNSLKLTANAQPVTVDKVAKGDTVKVAAFGKTKSTTGTEDTDISSAVEFTSSKNAIATVDESGNVSLTGAIGEVTITAKAGNLTKSVTFTVGANPRDVDATQSTVSTTTVKDAENAEVKFTVVLKDQYGEVMTGKATDISFAADGVVSSTVAEDAENKGTYTVTATLLDATEEVQNVELTVGSVKIATIKVSIVEPGEVNSYEVVPTVAKLDLFGEDKDATTIKVTAKDKNGYAVPAESVVLGDNDNFVVKSSNDKVVKFVDGKLVAEAKGTAKVTVYKKDGSIEDKIGEFTIEVIDSTPTLASATVSSITEQDGTQAIDLSDYVSYTLDGSGEYEEVEFTYSGNEVIAGDYGTVGYVYVTGTEAAALTEDGQIVFTVTEAVEATVELTITDKVGKILSEITFVLDAEEPEDEE